MHIFTIRYMKTGYGSIRSIRMFTDKAVNDFMDWLLLLLCVCVKIVSIVVLIAIVLCMILFLDFLILLRISWNDLIQYLNCLRYDYLFYMFINWIILVISFLDLFCLSEFDRLLSKPAIGTMVENFTLNHWEIWLKWNDLKYLQLSWLSIVI